MSAPDGSRSLGLRSAWPGVVAVAATYVSFLLHAQFGFLALAEERLGDAHDLQRTMAAMGLTGLAVSLLTGAALRVLASTRWVAAAFVACALAAIVPLACHSSWAFAGSAAFVGASTGLLTVMLATRLREWLPAQRLGLLAGIGTGVAYFIANLPFTFHGGPLVQAVVPALACLIAAGALLLRPAREALPDIEPRALGASDARGLGFATLVAAFLALVWLDSAAFWIIQETVELKGQTWGEGSQTLVQGTAHLVAAIAAGWLIDRGFFRSLLLGTFALFTVAFGLLEGGWLPVAVAGPLYALGISTYSTALVVAPSLGPRGPGLVPVRWRAAVLYAIAGWLGSALGIGMAQDLHRVPPAFTAAAGAVLLIGAAIAARSRPGRLARTVGPAFALVALGSPLVLPAAETVQGSAVERGRRVYVAEGCINCHSQFVRPGTFDEVAWGPFRDDQLDEAPPLLGVRRNGPDLLNVGNRRGAAWHRLHLQDPRALSPGSRMPSYASLFDDGRGEDLVAYLSSLGAERPRERARVELASEADPALGRRVFADSCAPCHGAAGRGDGPLASRFGGPFLDLQLKGLPLVPRVTGTEAQDLAQVVRWGLPGGRMPGHELLTDTELASVVAHLRELRRSGPAVTEASR